MEKLYRKRSNGRYESIGFNGVPDLTDGIWLVQSKPGWKSSSNLIFRIGDVKGLVDITTHAALQAMSNDLALYVSKLQDESSDEFLDAKELLGSWIKGPISISGIASADLSSLLLRRIAFNLAK